MKRGAAFVLVFFRLITCAESQQLGPTPGATADEFSSTIPELKRGEELAHAVCQACHLFPEPDVLDKKTWQHGAFMRMAPLLGVGHIDLDKRPDGAILRQSGIFPKSPVISERDWRLICQYYLVSAPAQAVAQGPRCEIQPGLAQFKVRPVRYPGATALTTMVQIDPASRRLYVGNAGARTLDILNANGQLLTRVPVDSPPVSLTVRPEGLYVTLIGNIFPSDERNGEVVLLEKSAEQYQPRTILKNLQRPASALLTDVNGDGREDIVLCEFGNYLGKFGWFENQGGGRYEEHRLIELPGALNALVFDTHPRGLPNVIVLMAQAREGIHLFQNQGGGEFQEQIITNFPPIFGSTHLELADFNNDGFPDLLVSNGDNGEYPSPFKNYHGIRIFLNDGHNHFKESWFFPMNGAFKAIARDLNHDGRLDILAISFFPDYQKSPEESFIYFKNKGNLSFEAYSFPECTAGRWLTMDANDLDGDGDVDIVLGSFAQGPQSIPIPRTLQQAWRTNGFSVLLLENQAR